MQWACPCETESLEANTIAATSCRNRSAVLSAGLPRETQDYVWQRLWGVLSKPTDKFEHLSPADRQAIIEIVRATKPQSANVLGLRNGSLIRVV